MPSIRDYIDLVNEAEGDVTVPGGGSITNVDPNSPEGQAMIARSQAVQAGQAQGAAAAPAPGANVPNPPPKAPAQWNKGVLGKGSKGPQVNELQKKLGIPETGVYDAATITAVQALQKKLGVTADGAYGPQTKAAHDKMPQQAATPAPQNVAAPGQPPATAADPSKGTVAGATKAIPTAPVDPTNPSGVGAKAQLTPDQAATKQDILSQPTDAAGNTTDATGTVYKRDLDWLKNFGNQTAPAQTQTATTATTTGGNATTVQAPPELTGLQAPAGQTAGGAVTARPVAAATGARAQALQRQQAQNQMPESRNGDTQFQKQLNAMRRIAGLKDNGL